MKLHEQAIRRAVVSHQDEGGEFRTIPEELMTVHPRELRKEMLEVFDDCRFIQEKVLEEILYLGRNSVFAKDHGLVAAVDLPSWREQAKITEYADYLPYIEAEMRMEGGQLFSGETAMYIATTGSTSDIKYFIESKAGNAAKQLVMAIRGMYMSEILPVTLDMQAKNLTISNFAAVGHSLDGKLIVRASGQTARNMREKTGTMNILPVEFWEVEELSSRDRDYMICVYALAEKRLAKIFCNNLYHFGRLLDRIEVEGPQMIEDVRRGSFSVPLTGKARASLLHTFAANQERAQELQAVCERDDGLVASPAGVAAIWPNLSMVGCWLSAGVGRDAREVLRRLPSSVRAFDLGYGASEAKLNIPVQLACPAGPAAPFGCFYEFLPLDGGQPLAMWEVEENRYYELLITTYSGLYRYNILDIVRIDGFIGKTPIIEFCGKSNEYLLIQGRKILGYQLNEAMRRAEARLGLDLGLVQVFAKDNAFYFAVESEQDLDAAALKLELDRETMRGVGLTCGGVYVMQRGYKDCLFSKRIKDDRGACGIKLPFVLDREPEDCSCECTNGNCARAGFGRKMILTVREAACKATGT